MNRLHFSIAPALLVLLLAGTAPAQLESETVRYEAAGLTLEGYLVWDGTVEGPRPGVLLVHEWWGLDDYARMRSEQLAEAGYVVFAADMYGEGRVTEHPAEAGEWAAAVRANVDQWRQRARAALQILRDHDRVDPDRIAAIGYCFGGATVLQLAYSGAPVHGVVSFHGALPTPSPEDARRIDARILVCHGAADPFIPEEAIRAFRDGLEEAGVDYQFIAYGGAVHSFTVPGADERLMEGIGYDADADRRSWRHMKLFFEELFDDPDGG